MSTHGTDSSQEDILRSLTRDIVHGRLSRRDAVLRGAALGLSASALMALNGGIAFAQATPGASPEASPAASPVAVAAIPTVDPNAKSGGTLKVGLQADPAELDPHKTQLTAAWHVIEHIYDGLVSVSPSLTPVPALAESWEISADGITYTFKLRSGVKFHNGREMTADDVKYSLERIVDPATASPAASDFEVIATVESADAQTSVITLKTADASFMSKLMGNAAKIVPQEEVEKNGDLMNTAVGTGPFKFVEYIPNSSFKVEKNADFWIAGLPYLDGIEFTIAPEATSRTAALVSNTVDFIEYAPVQDMETFKGDSTIAVTGDANTNIRYMAINVSREPYDKIEVRQAIAKVVDRGPIIDASIFGFGTPMETIFPESFWAGQKQDIAAPDIEGAKALLEQAGVSGLKPVITSWAQYAFLSNAAVVIQEQLKAIGIEAELNLQENATYLADYFGGNFDLSVTGTSGYIDPNDVLYQNFKTGADNNGIKYSNAEVDSLLDQGLAETDQAKRAEIYNQVQAILLEDLPWVNLFIANQYEAMRTFVKGYVHLATGSNAYFREVWLDK
ncbi:MAG: ABC transporter substrate-binding protein [Thermomicrobiales bacterium]